MRTGGRVLAFNVVGAIGFLVQALALWLLVGWRGVPAVPATAVAVELAVLHNFAWHARWTWGDRPAGWRASAGRLVRFNLSNGAVSLAVNVALMALLRDRLGLHYLGANVAGVACASVANYILGDRVVFLEPARALPSTPSRSPAGLPPASAPAPSAGAGSGIA